MDQQSYNDLMARMNSLLSKYNTHLVSPNPSRSQGSDDGLITEKQEINNLTENELLLMHVQLHMLYSQHGGKNLSLSAIKRLHKDISQKLKHHKYFDKLDENGLLKN